MRDLCKKQIKGEPIVAGLGFKRKELCLKCGAPILKFLDKNKLIEIPKILLSDKLTLGK